MSFVPLTGLRCRNRHAAPLLLCLLAACAAPPLNSERIAASFGSYAVTVIAQDARWRVSSLESRHDGRAVTRTLAVVRFEQPSSAALAAEDRRIRDGASIGSTFREAGWRIDKPLLYTGEIRVAADASGLAALMDIELPATLAVHVYRFDVKRAGRRHTYARIAELHHPDYLDLDDLRDIYGVAGDGAARSAARLLGELDDVLTGLPDGLAR